MITMGDIIKKEQLNLSNHMALTRQGVLAILSMSPERRYEYLVKKVTDFETLWVLFSEEEGFALNVEEDGRQYIPIWPSKEFSDTWTFDEYQGFSPKEIDLSKFINDIIPKLAENKIDILCFPTQGGWGLKVKCLKFRNDLIEDMKQYE